MDGNSECDNSSSSGKGDSSVDSGVGDGKGDGKGDSSKGWNSGKGDGKGENKPQGMIGFGAQLWNSVYTNISENTMQSSSSSSSSFSSSSQGTDGVMKNTAEVSHITLYFIFYFKNRNVCFGVDERNLELLRNDLTVSCH